MNYLNLDDHYTTKTFQQSKAAINRWTVETCGLNLEILQCYNLSSSISEFFSPRFVVVEKQHACKWAFSFFQSQWPNDWQDFYMILYVSLIPPTKK